LVQGNIPIKQKWSLTGLENSVKTYFDITRSIVSSDIVIWPETAISMTQNQARSTLQSLNDLGKLTHSAIATGILWQNDQNQLFNAVLALGYESKGVYLKRHLVPFGEYEPYPAVLGPIFKALHIPMSDLSSGKMQQPLITVAGQAVAPFICYEVTYPHLVIRSAQGAAWLLTVSDDSWFGRSWASAQQLQIAQMRSLETGLEMAYATSNGITAFINSQGRIVKRAPQFTQTTLTGTLQARTGLTPISIYGPFCIIALLLISVIIGVYVCTGSKD